MVPSSTSWELKMTLKNWEHNGWLKAKASSRQEIQNLLAIVERDLTDAAGSISADWRFGIAYNAALKLCTILLRAEGYLAAHGLQHYRTLQAMPLVLGESRRRDADYLEVCRIKRNTVEYDRAGAASEDEARELVDFATGLKADVLAWLDTHHAELK